MRSGRKGAPEKALPAAMPFGRGYRSGTAWRRTGATARRGEWCGHQGAYACVGRPKHLHVRSRGWTCEVLQELGSGFNDHQGGTAPVGTELVVIDALEDVSFEEERVRYELEIMTGFSAWLYASRSRPTKMS